MKLRSLRVEQLRQFRQPFELAELHDGINVITGPNESGKSTLVRAIRAAFIERHKSASVDDLQPWGDSATIPTVELRFEWQGELWHLIKSFLKKKRCDLQVGKRSYSGDEAEEQLAALLGFEFAGRGASRPEHWGIPGLLWIEQGAGQQIREPVTHAASHLQAALGASLGEVASTSGDALLEQIGALRAKLRTNTGRPTGDFAKLLSTLTEARSTREALQSKVSQYQQQVDQLGQLRIAQLQDEQERLWEQYRTQAQQAAAQLAAVQALQQAQHSDQQALAACRESIGARRDLLDTLTARQDQQAQRSATLGSAEQRLHDLEEQEASVTTRLQDAHTNYQQARSAVQQARAAQQRLQLEQELQQLRDDLATQSANLAQAQALRASISSHRQTLQATDIDSGAVAESRDLSDQLDRLRVREEMVATRLRYTLDNDHSVSLNGEPLRGQGEALLLEQGELTIAGVGTLAILPGGRDIGELQRDKQNLEDQFTHQLHSLGIATLEEAEQRLEAARTLRERIAQDERVMATLATDGIDALAERIQLKESRRAALEETLRGLPSPENGAPSLARAEAQLEAAESALREAQSHSDAHRETLSLARQEAVSAARELAQLEAELASPEHQQRARQAGDQLLELRAQESQLVETIQQRQQQIDEARPDTLQQDVERLNRSADAAEKTAEQRRLELERLQASLQALGAEGLEDQLALLDGEVEQLTRRERELTLRADALDLLLERLQSGRLAVTRQLQAPLQRHLNHYLQLLFPQASLTVNEQLVPELLTRPSAAGPEHSDFEALSFGAREQTALISRLAYADLLQQAGRPTLIILDDALVHSDPQRLAQMKRILFDAAQRHQILLFSCHPENWRDLGVVPRELGALR